MYYYNEKDERIEIDPAKVSLSINDLYVLAGHLHGEYNMKYVEQEISTQIEWAAEDN